VTNGQEALKNYNYLTEVDEDKIWENYTAAIEYVILHEKEWGDIDPAAKESLQRINNKWIHKRVNHIE
jgi:hypothetical protein